MSSKEQHDTKLLDLARQYEARGYTVRVEPAREAVPFDLGGYRPDLLAEKGDEHLLVELKTGGPLPISYLQQIVETVRQHSGWRFILERVDRLSSTFVLWPVMNSPTANGNFWKRCC